MPQPGKKRGAGGLIPTPGGWLSVFGTPGLLFRAVASLLPLAGRAASNDRPPTATDYQALSVILSRELGCAEDYHKEYQSLPFGPLQRKVDGMEHEADMRAFSHFINNQGLDQEQIVYVNKVVDDIVQNDCIGNVTKLMEAPFDKPHSFIKLFYQLYTSLKH